ncbi:hypothetical protein [Pseudomonas sp. GM25]|uniref:hypothetical protein n=1 Tax=Pseudomonas sp. GM25 TaxID=1144327 RepID=UPI0002700500|nr:hypothetical protein [Pseudomonas sp. GM25]EJM26375.1 hypothetical protein PMI24_03766 [Pseudomonas sp. GM25]
MSTTVVFDSNVWELIVDDAKRADAKTPAAVRTLYTLINDKVITSFIFEGIANFEAIPRKGRKAFVRDYKATISMSEGDQAAKKINGTPAAEISEQLEATIEKAASLDFSFIHLPRIAAPRHQIVNKYKAPEALDLETRLERSFRCARDIESMGCGMQVLKDMLLSPENGLLPALQDDPIAEKKFSEGVAEWMDGDALAATYGYGHEYFCTYDQGKNAGQSSILHPKNRATYMQKYGVKIVTPEELIAALISPAPV